ncbi:hypothetical protein OHA72_17205 [Dactylosporangium sp. NBC_01737]|uniref:hypothetical protein n=1 Tax=Dactylosporangium sp. NBC_01737 TaxID=2975959 RepID=UPI002E10BE80|nr:hypothetical protein OHA72_17205 [Dactylosporangium sp. NBC_01737]
MADLVVMTASGTTLIFRARVIVRRAAVIEVVCWSSGRPQGDFDQSDRDRAPAGRLRGVSGVPPERASARDKARESGEPPTPGRGNFRQKKVGGEIGGRERLPP